MANRKNKTNERGAEDGAYPHPRLRSVLFGHEAQEDLLLQSLRTGKLHHALLLTGPFGIGKATFAYRLARWLLSGTDPQTAENLFIPEDSKIFHQIAQGAHPDFHSVEAPVDKNRKTIGVDAIRELTQDMRTTSGQGKWRIAIIDAVDDLNLNAANALLKILEEPPPHCLFLLISHQPGRLLPTIRSRCQKVQFKPLGGAELKKAVLAIHPDASLDDMQCDPAQGSVREMLDLLIEGEHEIGADLETLLAQLPYIDFKRLHGVIDSVSRRGEGAFAAAVKAVLQFCYLNTTAGDEPSAVSRLADFAAGLEQGAASVSAYNLDRKAFLVTQLTALARLIPKRAAA